MKEERKEERKGEMGGDDEGHGVWARKGRRGTGPPTTVSQLQLRGRRSRMTLRDLCFTSAKLQQLTRYLLKFVHFNL